MRRILLAGPTFGLILLTAAANANIAFAEPRMEIRPAGGSCNRGPFEVFAFDLAPSSDFLVDSLYAWWKCQSPEEQARVTDLQIKTDNGPESSGRRTQFLKRMVEFADHTGKSIHLLYYPPYHSKYNPVERCWGILEKHWNGAKLTDTQTMLAWARSMTRKDLPPVVEWSRTVYEKGISLAKQAMQMVESRLERNPRSPKCDTLIRPACVVRIFAEIT